MGNKPTVFVVDDDPAVRKGLERLLEEVRQPVKLYDGAKAFLDDYRPDAPGCLVLDVRMPGMSGIDVQQTLVDQDATLPIILISAHGNVRMAVDAVKRGAFDFIEKPFDAQRLLDCIQHAIAHDETQRAARVKRVDAEARLSSLTQKEREVLDFAVNGMTNKDIAARLGVTPQAIDARRANALQKLGICSVPEAAQLLAVIRNAT